MKSKQGCISITVIFILVLGYLMYDYFKFESRAISDCTKNEIFYLTTNKSFITSCKIKVKGKVDGLAKINTWTIGPGKVDTLLYYGDWYEQQYKIEYRNISVTKGRLKVFYKF